MKADTSNIADALPCPPRKQHRPRRLNKGKARGRQPGATTRAQVTQEEITARIAASGINAIALPHVDAAPVISETLRANDVAFLLTSGALGGLIEALPPLAERLFPA